MNKINIIARTVLVELIRRKDFYLIFTLLLVILLYSATISFGGEKGFDRYFKELGISLTFIFSIIIAVVFGSRQIPQEIEAKTIYPVLVHPVSRLQFILGKFLGVFLVSVGSFSIFYLTFIASFLFKGDFSTPPILLIEGYILHVCLLSFIVSLTILLSLFLSITANAGVALLLYFGTNWFGVDMPEYILLPHPELFDIKEKIVHSWDAVPLWAMSFLIAYAAIYTTIFLSMGYLSFRRRNL